MRTCQGPHGHCDSNNNQESKRYCCSSSGWLASLGLTDVSCRYEKTWRRTPTTDNRRYEAISLSGNCLYELWPLGIVFQRLPKFANRAIDAVVGVKEDAIAPDSLDDLFAADEPVSALDQEEQHFHGDAFQLDCAAGPAQLIDVQIELEIRSKFDYFLGSDWLG